MLEDEQRYRASAYGLLAALLRAPPERALLDYVSDLSPAGEENSDELAQALADLAAASREADPAALDDEYHALFIGVGGGELMPYGSWYLTGYMMEQPLADLRDDLARLGFERNAEVREPEDHISALFEVFSVMIADAVSLDEQRDFYQKHVLPWVARFFDDLDKARSAEFYRTVARFGAAFNQLESTYLSMRS